MADQQTSGSEMGAIELCKNCEARVDMRLTGVCDDCAQDLLGQAEAQVEFDQALIRELEDKLGKARACRACGNEQRDHRDLLTCECRDPLAVERQARIEAESARDAAVRERDEARKLTDDVEANWKQACDGFLKRALVAEAERDAAVSDASTCVTCGGIGYERDYDEAIDVPCRTCHAGWYQRRLEAEAEAEEELGALADRLQELESQLSATEAVVGAARKYEEADREYRTGHFSPRAMFDAKRELFSAVASLPPPWRVEGTKG